MKEPGLDGRHRDKNPPKAGEIQQKRSDTLRKICPVRSRNFRRTQLWNHAGENRKSQRGRRETGGSEVR